MTALLEFLIVADRLANESESFRGFLEQTDAPRLFLLPFGQNLPSHPAGGKPTASIAKPVKTSALTQAGRPRASADTGYGLPGRPPITFPAAPPMRTSMRSRA